jgi:septal ring factor EnvC (AmiA/AmiB activator)
LLVLTRKTRKQGRVGIRGRVNMLISRIQQTAASTQQTAEADSREQTADNREQTADRRQQTVPPRPLLSLASLFGSVTPASTTPGSRKHSVNGLVESALL